MTAATSTAHSVPPDVTVEAVGRDRDIAVITLDLEGGTIARSILRGLSQSLFRAHRVMILSALAAETPVRQGLLINEVLGHCKARTVFQVDLTLDAAQALYEELGRTLEVADTECAAEGCHAIGLLDGYCAADDERRDTRRAG